MRPQRLELRRRILETYAAGEGSLRELAARSVNRAWKRMGLTREGRALRAPELGEPDERES